MRKILFVLVGVVVVVIFVVLVVFGFELVMFDGFVG